MRKPELVLLVAIWEFIAAFLTLLLLGLPIAGIVQIVYEYRFGYGIDRPAYIGGIVILSIVILTFVIYIGVSIAGGVGLLIEREWGRIVSIVQASLSLLAIPFGTIIGVLVLIYLTRTQVRDYFVRPVLTVPTLLTPPAGPPVVSPLPPPTPPGPPASPAT